MPLVLTGDGAVGPLSASEVGFLDGVTSSVQTQINAKANDASQGFYFITSQTFSAASAVNVNNCFSSTYDNYRVVCGFPAPTFPAQTTTTPSDSLLPAVRRETKDLALIRQHG